MGGNINNKNKNKNGQSAPQANTSAKAKEKKKKSGTEIFLIVFAIIAVIGIVASIIIGVVVSSKKNQTFDYLEDDLSKYVTVSGYKGFEIEVNTDPVEDIDVEQALLKVLYQNRADKPYNNGANYLNVPVTAGDIAKIYYRGYTVENGEKVYFDGGCNFTGTPTDLGIGSGSFIVGFELGLLGKKPSDYSSFTANSSTGKIGKDDKIFIVYSKTVDKVSTATATAVVDLSLGKDKIDETWGTLFYAGLTEETRYYGQEYKIGVETDNGAETVTLKAYRVVGENQLISVKYSAFMANGDIVQGKSAMIDLSDPDLDTKYGEGFRDFFLSGVPIGIKAVDEKNVAAKLNTVTKDGDKEGKNSFFDITVDKTFTIGDNPLTVEVMFPTDYTAEDLRGKKAFFDVYITELVIYDFKSEYNTPADIDDAYITEVLKLTAEDLEDYEGETLTEKYRDKTLKGLIETYEKTKRDTLYNALLQHYVKCAKVEKLPESEVQAYYDQYYADIENQYAQYSSYYGTIDAFARAYLQLSTNADWKAELQKIAEEAVTQKLVFYSVVRAENAYIPDAEFKIRYEKEFNKVFEQYLGNIGCKPDKYDTTEEYEKAVAEYREQFASYYGEDYFRDNIVYEYAFEKLSGPDYVTVKAPSDKYAE